MVQLLSAIAASLPMSTSTSLFFLCLFVCLFFAFLRATPAAHGGSQARAQIGAVATGLHHSHSNARSKPHLPPTEQDQGSNLQPHGS